MSDSVVFNITSILDDDHEETKTIPFHTHSEYGQYCYLREMFVTSSMTNSTKYNVVLISAIFTPLRNIHDDLKDSICIIFGNSQIGRSMLNRICQEIHQLGAVALIVLEKLERQEIYVLHCQIPVFFSNVVLDFSHSTAKNIQCTITKSSNYLQENESPTRDYFIRTLKSNETMTIQTFLPLYEHLHASYDCRCTYGEMAELMDTFLQGSETMKHKLFVLDYLENSSWYNCFRGKWNAFICSHIGKIKSTDDSTLVNLNECLRMISTNEKFFCSARRRNDHNYCNQDNYKSFATHLANACTQIIFDNPKVAQDIPFPTNTSGTPKFFNAFVEALQSGLKRYTKISVAVAFYLRVLEQVPSSKELLVHRLSWDLLCTVLKSWNPNCITDIQIVDRQLIDILFTPSIADIIDDTATKIKLRNIVMGVLNVWTSNVNDDSVELSELVHFKKLTLSNTFEAYEKFMKKSLPSAELIQNKIDHIDCVLLDKRHESIRHDMTSTSHIASDSIIPTKKVKLFGTGQINGTTIIPHQLEGVISVQEGETFDQQKSSLPVPVLDKKYDSTKQKLNLQLWLDYHCLPQSVADLFVTWGIRSVDDVFLFLSKQNQNNTLIDKLLSQLPILDRIKLCDAATAGSSVASNCDCNDELTENEVEYKNK